MKTERIAMPLLRATAKRDWASKLADRVLKPWNPFTPSRYSDPYPLYEQIRAAGQVSFQRGLGSWNIVGYEECETVLRSPHTSVDQSSLFSIVPPYSKLQPSTRGLFLNTMLFKDPPDHTRLRRLVNRAFTPRRMAELEPSVVALTEELIDEFAAEPSIDAMPAFCNRLPIRVISEMLGLPRSRWDEFQELSNELIKFIDPIVAFDVGVMERSVERYRSMMRELFADRRAKPRDDMLTRLVEAHEDGDRLDEHELESMVAILMVAGHETTAGFLGNALLALHEHPDQRARLRNEPDLIDNAVEELFRFDAPVQQSNRYTTAELDVGGHRIGAGRMLVVFFGAANRDPARYDAPNELRLDRPDPRPMSFSHGIHHCLGAALARIEARVALPMFVQRFPDYAIDVEHTRWKRSLNVRGPATLPMRL